jgi:peptidoglycan/LPS O-acetylase OafA/YrhL
MEMKDRLGVLDGMRGVAVLLVLWYHVWEISWLAVPAPWLQWIPETGFVGVHMFFFLSGFVIVYPFVRAQVHGEPEPTWVHFAWRRFLKIMPSYALSIVVAYAIGYAAIVRYDTTPLQEIVTHLLFVHTWWPTTYGSINGVLWTLAIEVEFYAIFPLIWWCFKRRAWLTGAGMIAIALIWRIHARDCCANSDTMSLLVENLPGYLDIFACGMLSAWIFARHGRTLRASPASAAMPLLALAGTIVLARLLIGMFDNRTVDQWQVALQIILRPVYGISFAAIALGLLTAPVWARWILDNAPLRFLGIISYNLYLYHQMVARELVRLHVPPYSGNPHFDPAWQVRYTAVAFLATIAQAALVTYLIERPILRLPEPRLIRKAVGHST